MTGLVRYVRAYMGRRIFAWFGATILATVFGVMLIVKLFLLAGSPTWKQEFERVRDLAGHQFARVWDDPEQRDAIVRDVAQDMDFHVRFEDTRGAVLAQHGGACFGHKFVMPVRRDGVVLGRAYVCDRRDTLLTTLKVGASLLVVVLCLWFGSWMVARGIARPLREIAQVSEAMGQGDLKRRAHMAQVAGGEIGVVADALHEMASRIERQLNDQKTLLAGVSHELRTPLGHLRMIIEMARAMEVPEHLLEELEREVLEMDELVDQLLATSRLNFEVQNLHELDATILSVEALERTGVAPELLEVTDSLKFLGDAMLVRRALANLVTNARVHGGGVTGMRVERRDDAAAFLVEDAGDGMPEGERQRLFEPFVQNTTSSGSLGLGLFLVKRIALAHGGDVIVEENEPRGARVGFWVPLSQS